MDLVNNTAVILYLTPGDMDGWSDFGRFDDFTFTGRIKYVTQYGATSVLFEVTIKYTCDNKGYKATRTITGFTHERCFSFIEKPQEVIYECSSHT